MVLTKPEILKKLREDVIKIEPFDERAVGPASVDLTLDNSIRVFDSKGELVTNETDYKRISRLVSIEDGYLLKPEELVLGITVEKITLPENICGWLNSRSRFARIGLMSHITAPFIAPGVSNKQVLEIFNAGQNRIKLVAGTRICQIVFQECKGKAKYEGRFKDQEL